MSQPRRLPTLKALELGAVETLVVWENLDITRYTLRNAAGGQFSHLIYSSNLTIHPRGYWHIHEQGTRERS